MIAREAYGRLLRPVVGVALVGLLTKVAQLAAGVLLAWRFGAGVQTDAYLLARSLPVGIYLIADSLIYNSVVPLYKRHAAHGAALESYVVRLFGGVLLAGLAMGFLLYWQAARITPCFAPGANASFHQEAAQLLRLCGLALAFALPASLLKALNAAQGRFLLAALDGFVISVMLLAALLAAPWMGGIIAPAASLTLAFVLLFGLQGYWARPPIFHRDRPAPGPWLWETLALMTPLAALTAVQQFNNWIMNAAASMIETGAIACLNFSYSLAQIPVGIIDLVLFSTLFPFAAALAARARLEDLRAHFILAAFWISVLLLPMSLLLAFEGKALVGWMLRHGHFGPVAAELTGRALWGHGAAMIFWALEALGCRCLFALRRHWWYCGIVVLRVGLNLAGCFLLGKAFGLVGVSLSFALSFIFGAGLSTAAVLYTLPNRRKLSFRAFLHNTLSLGGVVLLALGCLYFGQTLLPGESGPEAFLRLALEGGVCLSVSLGVGLWRQATWRLS